jgi:hypothetical protein
MSLLGPFELEWKGAGQSIMHTVNQTAKFTKTWFFDTIKYEDGSKKATTVRRTALRGDDDYNLISENGLIPDPRSDLQLVLADVDASLFSPDCLECGKTHTSVLQFQREPLEGDNLPDDEGEYDQIQAVVINLSTCGSPLCRHKLRKKVKAEAKRRSVWIRQLYRKKCDKCNEVKEKVFVCSKCKLVKYCGRDCQKEHWKTHKSDCQPCEE